MSTTNLLLYFCGAYAKPHMQMQTFTHGASLNLGAKTHGVVAIDFIVVVVNSSVVHDVAIGLFIIPIWVFLLPTTTGMTGGELLT